MRVPAQHQRAFSSALPAGTSGRVHMQRDATVRAQIQFHKYQGLGNNFIMVRFPSVAASLTCSSCASPVCELRLHLCCCEMHSNLMPAARAWARAALTCRAVICSAASRAELIVNWRTAHVQIDSRQSAQPPLDSAQAKRWCDVCFGVGGDGVIFALPPQGDTDLTMRLYNSDGSEPEMCGNGIRCLAKFVADLDGSSSGKYRVHTLAGARACCSSQSVHVCSIPMHMPL